MIHRKYFKSKIVFLTVLFLLVLWPKEGHVTIGSYRISDLNQLFQVSTMVVVAEPLGIIKAKAGELNAATGLPEKDFRFKLVEVVSGQWNKNSIPLESKTFTVHPPLLSNHIFSKPDGTMIGSKGPLILSYDSSLNEQAMLQAKKVILFLKWDPSSKSDRWATYEAWESIEHLKEILKMISNKGDK